MRGCRALCICARSVRALHLSQAIETACTELKIHDTIETEIFYPAVREAAEKEGIEDTLDEAEVEHDTVCELIAKLEGINPSDEKRHARFTVLTEYVKHHVKEEEKEMLPSRSTCRRSVSR